MPSFRAICIWLLRRPIVTISSRSAFVVRSPLMTAHESPRLVDRNTRCAATISVPGSCGEKMIGVSQLNRNCPCVSDSTFSLVGRMLFDSPVAVFFRVMFPFCDSV